MLKFTRTKRYIILYRNYYSKIHFSGMKIKIKNNKKILKPNNPNQTNKI